MCKVSLEVGSVCSLPYQLSFRIQQRKSIIWIKPHKILPSDLKLNQETIQLQLSFLIATRSVSLADSWQKLQWRWRTLDMDRTTNALQGVGCVRVPGRDGRVGDAWRLWPQSDKILWDTCVKKKESRNRDKKGCCSLPFYQLCVKLFLCNSLENRALTWQHSTTNLSLDHPGHTHLNLKCTADTRPI